MNWTDAWHQLQTADPDTTCDGLYCGGPFTHSLAFFMLCCFAAVGIVGLIVATAQSRGGK